MLSNKKDMHVLDIDWLIDWLIDKRKISISMAAILDFFNLNLLSVQKKMAP